MGVTSFQALNAPMLLDSYALQAAVLESGLTDTMMQPLNDIGVTGVATLAGNLRKPAAVEAALVDPADWQGVTFGTYLSEAEFKAIRALGAKPKAVFGSARDQAVRAGSIGGFEQGLLALQAQHAVRDGAVPDHQRHPLAPDADRRRQPRPGRPAHHYPA